MCTSESGFGMRFLAKLSPKILCAQVWVFSRDSALRLVDDAKRFFFDTKVFGGLDIDMIYFSLRAACFQ